MAIRYKGMLVTCCCENCLHACGKMCEGIKCAEDDKFHNPLDECGKYEFSWQRFEEK